MSNQSLIKLSCIIAISIITSGCVVAPNHHLHAGRHKVERKVVVKSAIELDTEHSSTTILVVSKADPKRSCWKHGNHFHCGK